MFVSMVEIGHNSRLVATRPRSRPHSSLSFDPEGSQTLNGMTLRVRTTRLAVLPTGKTSLRLSIPPHIGINANMIVDSVEGGDRTHDRSFMSAVLYH